MPLIAGAEPFLAPRRPARDPGAARRRWFPVSVTSWAQHLAHAGHTVAAPGYLGMGPAGRT